MTESEVRKQIAECNRRADEEYANLIAVAKSMGTAAHKTASNLVWITIGGTIIISLLLCAIAGALELWAPLGVVIIVGLTAGFFISKHFLNIKSGVDVAKNKLDRTLGEQSGV